MHGNKRTARAIAELVSAKLHCPWDEYDFSRNDKGTAIYQIEFTRALWLRDYASLQALHIHFKKRHYYDASAEEKRQLYDKLFGTKVE